MSALRGWGPRGRTLLLVAFVGLLAGLTAPRAVSAQTSPSADLVARGKYVFGATGGCGCHTEKDRTVNSGGRKYDGPFGTVYSSNITPDKQTGLGGWTDEQIITAIRLGRRPDGERLIPVHPYPVFNGMAAEDLRALVAFLRTIPPVNRPNTPKKISVLHAEVFCAKFFHDSTPVINRIAMPANAADVASMLSVSPSTHSASSRTKVPTMIHSLRDTGPASRIW